LKVLVTGGAGFIGSQVADRLIEEGHEVAIVDNLSTGFRENIHPRAKLYEADIRDASRLREIFDAERPECVNHHAAQIDVRRSVEDPEFDARTNILGSLDLLTHAVRTGVRKFIYVSTGGAVYGEPEYFPVDEDHPIRPEAPYGVSKHTVEHYLFLHSLHYKLAYTVLRYANVYGPRQNPNGEAGVNAIFIGSMLQGSTPTIFGDGEQVRDYVYVGDVVEANMRALESGDGRAFNIGSGVGTTVNEVYSKIADIIGFPRPPNYAPPRTGELQKIYLDVSRAGRELGWTPQVKFRDGLARTVEWFKARRDKFDL